MSQLSKVSGVATSIRTENGDTIVRYHSTDVVRFNASRIVLNSGGWRTVTTKTRMNQAANQFDLGFTVFQEKGEWYVSIRTGITINGSTGDKYQYADRMVINR